MIMYKSFNNNKIQVDNYTIKAQDVNLINLSKKGLISLLAISSHNYEEYRNIPY